MKKQIYGRHAKQGFFKKFFLAPYSQIPAFYALFMSETKFHAHTKLQSYFCKL
jgi:hypothetical protein